jgi:hypothetical protein
MIKKSIIKTWFVFSLLFCKPGLAADPQISPEHDNRQLQEIKDASEPSHEDFDLEYWELARPAAVMKSAIKRYEPYFGGAYLYFVDPVDDYEKADLGKRIYYWDQESVEHTQGGKVNVDEKALYANGLKTFCKRLARSREAEAYGYDCDLGFRLVPKKEACALAHQKLSNSPRK